VPKPYLIVSCDGGGVRGLLTALVLKELDRACDGLLRRVDLFAGTSTGGIIALGLAGGLDIDRIINLYKTKAVQIFTQYKLDLGLVGRPAADRAFRAFRKEARWEDGDEGGIPVNDLVAVRYTNDGLRKAIEAEFPTNPMLTGLRRGVLVTTLQLDDPAAGWRPLALHNLPPADGPGAKTHVVEAAMCTSAAPTYFEPFNHKELGYCVDGGVFANNPGALAVATAAGAGQAAGDIHMLSVGTGGSEGRYPFEKLRLTPRRLGILPWVWPKPNPRHNIPRMPLLAAMLDATSATDQLVCEGILGKRYRRVQVPLAGQFEMDDPAAIPHLERAVQAYLATDGWKAAVEWARGLPKG
jgi:uncharacterized protein